jgi:hypothetical protein
MTWISVLGSIFYHLTIPIITILGWLLVALAPLLHLGHYVASGLLLPLKLLAKFEVLIQSHPMIET